MARGVQPSPEQLLQEAHMEAMALKARMHRKRLTLG